MTSADTNYDGLTVPAVGVRNTDDETTISNREPMFAAGDGDAGGGGEHGGGDGRGGGVHGRGHGTTTY